MAQSAQPPQNRCDQPAHQGAVAVGKAFQSGMGGCAVELFIKRAMLVQDAVEDVSRYPPRRKAWRFSRQSKSLRGHGAGTSCNLAQQFALQLMPTARIDLALEYAKCKNPAYDFSCTRAVVMTDDPSQPEPATSVTGRKPLSPAAQRALDEAEARRKAAAAEAQSRPKEFQGPKGPEPTRYGDWENKGIASDF
jgi:hypothetical protein